MSLFCLFVCLFCFPRIDLSFTYAAVQVMVHRVENNLDVKCVAMEDRNVVEMILVHASYKNRDDFHLDFHHNHIEQVVEEFEDLYLVVDRNDTWPVEEMNEHKVYWDLALNRMDYNQLNRVKMMMLKPQYWVVKPNLYRGVVEDLMLMNLNDVVDDDDDLIYLFSDVDDDYSSKLNYDY